MDLYLTRSYLTQVTYLSADDDPTYAVTLDTGPSPYFLLRGSTMERERQHQLRHRALSAVVQV